MARPERPVGGTQRCRMPGGENRDGRLGFHGDEGGDEWPGSEPIHRNSGGTRGSSKSMPASPSFGESQGIAPWATAKIAAPGEK